jgi:squalene monooxygenase
LIIIGAGIAGCALAYSLANQGRRILLVERDLSQPDRIVGELLQPGGVAALHKLGLEDVLQGIDAVPVEGYCVMINGKRVGIPYPEKRESESWSESCTSGKNEGRSFHHGRLISNLRKKCLEHPSIDVLEGTVRDLVFCEHTNHVIGVNVAVKGANLRSYYAPVTVIADGCFSKFRTTLPEKGKDSRPQPKTRSHFVGVILENTVTPLPNHGTVCLTPSGPVLLYQIADEAKETRMLVDVKGKLPSVADGSLKVSSSLK